MEEPYPYVTFTPDQLKKLYEAREAMEEYDDMSAAYDYLDGVLTGWEEQYDRWENG